MIVKAIFKFIIKIASIVLAWLPDHTPIGWPSFDTISGFFKGLDAVSRFVDLRVFFLCLGLVFIFEGALMLYAAWRAILGLFPGLR